MQKRRNTIANALELRLFCIKPSTPHIMMQDAVPTSVVRSVLPDPAQRTNVGVASAA